MDRSVTWDPKQCRTAPGTLIKALVINVLSGRKALYRTVGRVHAEGVPLYGEVRDGNSSDKTWNQEVLNKLHEFLPVLNKDSIYIADSALITKDNLAIIQNLGVRFISRLPETFGMAEEVKQWAWETNRWINLGAISDKKDAAEYKVQSTIRELADSRYRFIACQSSNLDARKEKTIARLIEKEREVLDKTCRELGKRVFYCKADAEKEWQLFTRESSKILIVVSPIYGLKPAPLY